MKRPSESNVITDMVPLVPFDSPEALAGFIRQELGPLLKKNGKVFYSDFESYRNARVVFIGWNPRGNPKDGEGEQIGVKLADWLTWPADHKNNFTYEKWRTPLQQRAIDLFREIGDNIDKSFTSNLHFQSSENDRSDFGAEMYQASQNIWAHLFAAVPAKLVISYGTRTFWEIRSFFHWETSPERVPTAHGKWKAFRQSGRAFGRDVILWGLPHLSRLSLQRATTVIARLAADRLKIT